MKSRCYICDSARNWFYAEEDGYTLVKCSECGLLYVEDPPKMNEISGAFQECTYKDRDVTGVFNDAKIPFYLNAIEELFGGELSAIKTWLDVGCGHGEFMAAVKEYSNRMISVKGTELNARKRESARTRGLDVDYFDIEVHKNTYDAVSLLNVFSHLPDPPSFLSDLKRLLNPQGELILQTGDTANLSPKDHYRPFGLPGHLCFASEKIIVYLLERLDFEIISIKKYPFIRPDLKSFLKEFVKVFLPHYISRIRYYPNWKLYSQTNMFVRAKLMR